MLDDAAVDGWESIGEWETTIVEVSEGTHRLRGTRPFGLTQFGWNNSQRDACRPLSPTGTCQTSYAHAAGMAMPVP